MDGTMLERRLLTYLTQRGWQRLGWAGVVAAAILAGGNLMERWRRRPTAYAEPAVVAVHQASSLKPQASSLKPQASSLKRRPPSAADWRRFFAAVAAVESGGEDAAVGDGGRARGRYQITMAYWIDGGGDREAWATGAHVPAAAEQVMARYFCRYAPRALAAGDWPTLARIHHGGPRGASVRTTADYGRRVGALMEVDDAR